MRLFIFGMLSQRKTNNTRFHHHHLQHFSRIHAARRDGNSALTVSLSSTKKLQNKRQKHYILERFEAYQLNDYEEDGNDDDDDDNVKSQMKKQKMKQRKNPLKRIDGLFAYSFEMYVSCLRRHSHPSLSQKQFSHSKCILISLKIRTVCAKNLEFFVTSFSVLKIIQPSATTNTTTTLSKMLSPKTMLPFQVFERMRRPHQCTAPYTSL